MNIVKWALLAGSTLLFFAVLFGAFGAHAFDELLEKNQHQRVFDTASKYHFYHGFSLILFGLIAHIFSDIKHQVLIFYAFLIGSLIFCGSLYVLALLNISWLGAIAPIGGTLLLCGWLMLIYSLNLNFKILTR